MAIRNEALYLLLPRPLRNTALQDAVGHRSVDIAVVLPKFPVIFNNVLTLSHPCNYTRNFGRYAEAIMTCSLSYSLASSQQVWHFFGRKIYSFIMVPSEFAALTNLFFPSFLSLLLSFLRAPHHFNNIIRWYYDAFGSTYNHGPKTTERKHIRAGSQTCGNTIQLFATFSINASPMLYPTGFCGYH
jgi:hypothetical protein